MRSGAVTSHCKRVGISAKQLAAFHDVTMWTVCHWKRERPELFDRKLAEAAVALHSKKEKQNERT